MKKSDMICAWLPLDDLPTYSVSLASVHLQRREECSATLRRASFVWSDGKKSPLRGLRHACTWHLRPQASPCSRSLLRGCPHLPGVRTVACMVPPVWCGEAGETFLVGGQPVLYKTLCFLRRSALSGSDDLGCGARAESGLARRQGTGQAIHARAAAPHRYTGTQGDRHRRDIDSQGSYLPHCGERPDSASPDLALPKTRLTSSLVKGKPAWPPKLTMNGCVRYVT